MRKFVLLLPFIFLSSCSPTQCPFKDSFKNNEPTLQSAEDAMTKEFNENSFNSNK